MLDFIQHNALRFIHDIVYITSSLLWLSNILWFPGGSVVKSLPANAGDANSIPGSGRSLGEGNGNPLQYSCLGNPIPCTEKSGGLQPMGPCKELDTTLQLSTIFYGMDIPHFVYPFIS